MFFGLCIGVSEPHSKGSLCLVCISSVLLFCFYYLYGPHKFDFTTLKWPVFWALCLPPLDPYTIILFLLLPRLAYISLSFFYHKIGVNGESEGKAKLGLLRNSFNGACFQNEHLLSFFFFSFFFFYYSSLFHGKGSFFFFLSFEFLYRIDRFFFPHLFPSPRITAIRTQRLIFFLSPTFRLSFSTLAIL